ncbi:MAG: DUF1003 domain-containing protein [Micromonosporaceae bacterium]|nr:DUF1003 domain-containing protein [Micromonosporaceae bacterium]
MPVVERRTGRLDQPREPRRLTLPRFDPEAFGRWSEGFARFMGTPRFIVYMTVVILFWIGWNTLAPRGWRFDPYTFTFLTLVLSLQASYAAPLILLAQNRQTDRDRLTMEEDRRRAAMQKADTEYLSREIAALRIALGEVATRDFLRSELARLAEDLAEAGGSAGRDAKAGRERAGRAAAARSADGRKDAARRRHKAERRAARAAARRAEDTPDEPDDDSGSDAPYSG